MMTENTAILWTGGKDCALAFYKALKEQYPITHLVTFTPENPNFVAHPLFLMEKQIKSIRLPHVKVVVKEPMKKSYEDGISFLKKEYNIKTLVTGDIDEIENHSNWIVDCSKKSGMKVYNPLRKKSRKELLKELIQLNFHIIFTLVRKPFFDASWIGKRLDLKTLNVLEKMDIDLCGENGEYHTMVLHAPYYKQEIHLEQSKTKETEHYYCIKTNDS